MDKDFIVTPDKLLSTLEICLSLVDTKIQEANRTLRFLRYEKGLLEYYLKLEKEKEEDNNEK